MVAEVVNRAPQTRPPDGSTHWSARSLVAATGISLAGRAFVCSRPPFTAGCKPSRCSPTGRNPTAARKTDVYKFSADPFFVEKVHDIVGLYLNPPDKAIVLCVDEKTQIQALDRAHPLLSTGLGYVQGVSHGYISHGTTTLVAALDVTTGEVLTQCKPRHRHQDILGFLRQIEKSVSEDLASA